MMVVTYRMSPWFQPRIAGCYGVLRSLDRAAFSFATGSRICSISSNPGKSGISNEAGRCQEGFSSFLTLLESLFVSLRHTRALAQERLFSRRIFFRRRSF